MLSDLCRSKKNPTRRLLFPTPPQPVAPEAAAEASLLGTGGHATLFHLLLQQLLRLCFNPTTASPAASEYLCSEDTALLLAIAALLASSALSISAGMQYGAQGEGLNTRSSLQLSSAGGRLKVLVAAVAGVACCPLAEAAHRAAATPAGKALYYSAVAGLATGATRPSCVVACP